jgi:hypothetical protein
VQGKGAIMCRFFRTLLNLFRSSLHMYPLHCHLGPIFVPLLSMTCFWPCFLTTMRQWRSQRPRSCRGGRFCKNLVFFGKFLAFLKCLAFWANFGFFGKISIFVTSTDIFRRSRNIGLYVHIGYKNRYYMTGCT